VAELTPKIIHLAMVRHHAKFSSCSHTNSSIGDSCYEKNLGAGVTAPLG